VSGAEGEHGAGDDHRGIGSIEGLQAALAGERYLADDGLATAVFLALRLRRPLLVEGEPGVGKTELARALAAATGARLVRLQCYEGIDVHHALYDWDYPRQLLHLRAGGEDPLYSERFLVRRPLLEALATPDAALLIDELDRADDEFEAFLLEFLSDFQVTIPEVGVVVAEQPPPVIITSNRTRELHEALKRRCLYHWIDHPDLAREVAIARARLPELPEPLLRQACAFVQELRWLDLYRAPGVGETLDWAQSLSVLSGNGLELEAAERSLGALLKERDDLERVRGDTLAQLVERAHARARESAEGDHGPA
jgi:MoxR-like ATPase